jgi:peptide/nickel transport system substrate-binding protein
MAVATISLLAASWAGAQGKRAQALPRNQVLVTSGSAWGPESNFNPYSSSVTGVLGLCYETLLRYDPLADKYIPWLAQKAGFKGKKYVIVVRKGIKYSNGQALTAARVKAVINFGRHETAGWNVLWQNIKKMKVKKRTITIKFKGKPNYVQWQNLMWNLQLINPSQFSGLNKDTWTTIGSEAGFNPVCTGPYTVDRGNTASDGSNIVWVRNNKWWAAKKKVAPLPKPKYIEDLQNTSNTNALEGLLKDVNDLNNNYLPGIQKLVSDGDAQTYYPGKPYHNSANTAWLEVNTTHTPLGDAKFRKALAESVSVGYIVGAGDYNGVVAEANQTGLLKVWKKWINKKQLKKLGFKRSTAAAKATLAAAGYKDVNSDGYVENKDGSKIDLSIEVPQGWSDWEAARNIIVASAKNAGIRMHVEVGDYNKVMPTDRNQGIFDTMVDNFYQISDNPWTYWNGIFHLPVLSVQTFANFGRYKNNTAWKLVLKLDRTPPTKKGRKTAMKLEKKLQKIMLTQLPIIPMWYNGIWSQTQSKHWKNWPTSKKKKMHYIACMWAGYLNMTGIDTITHVKPA